MCYIANMNLKGTALKLTKAINHTYGSHIVLNSSAYFSDGQTEVTMWVIKDSVYTAENKHSRELFASASLVYVVFFLRDLWQYLQTGEIPSDEGDPGWHNMKEKKRAKGKSTEDSILYVRDTYIGVDANE